MGAWQAYEVSVAMTLDIRSLVLCPLKVGQHRGPCDSISAQLARESQRVATALNRRGHTIAIVF